jgi:hypothetical protein
VDALEPDRLVDAHHDRERRVDLGEGLEDARVAGLRQPLAAVLLGHVEPAQPALAQLLDDVVSEPALLLDLARVDLRLGKLAQRRVQAADLLLLVGVRPGHGKTSSSAISPMKSDFANDETSSRASLGFSVVAPSTRRA